MTRRGLLIAGGLALTGLLVPAAIRIPIWLIWNASASAPIGLYAVHPMRRPARGVWAVLTPPEPLARFAAERHYLPLGVPLIKPIAATAGHTVCRIGRALTIDHRPVGEARLNDGRGRPLPVWQGCRTLGERKVFVMNTAVKDSFDGRYFGPLPSSAVLGEARPLWIQPAVKPHPKEQRP